MNVYKPSAGKTHRLHPRCRVRIYNLDGGPDGRVVGFQVTGADGRVVDLSRNILVGGVTIDVGDVVGSPTVTIKLIPDDLVVELDAEVDVEEVTR